jgi:hypothetical protein
VREVILRADPRITEYLKYGSLNFGYEGDLAVFVQTKKKSVTLIFHRGARIPGRFPHFEGTHPSARFLRFADLAEVEARAAESTRITAAWCALVEPLVGDRKRPTKPARACRAKAGNQTRRA